MNTTLQIPIKKHLRDRAAGVAEKEGFSSLQEVVRVFLNQFADQEIRIAFGPRPVILSKKNDERYARMIEDVRLGRAKTKSFRDIDALMKDLQQ